MNETKLVKEILLALGNEPDFICWRNNTGKLADVNGRWVTYGIGVGSADIIGVLAPWGRFVALEVKSGNGRLRDAQKHWGDAVQRVFGGYFVVRSADEARVALEAARQYMADRWDSALPF